MFRARATWLPFSKRFKLHLTRPFCRKSIKTTNQNSDNTNSVESKISKYTESYKQLENLDFTTAARILFTDPPKENKFGLDFHLVQLFFVCLPSLAVYLVAQYARYEMRRMDADLEKKKKLEEEKAKELELKAAEDRESDSEAGLLEVKVRLDKLEKAVNEIVVESSKQLGVKTTQKTSEDGQDKSGSKTTPSASQQNGKT